MDFVNYMKDVNVKMIVEIANKTDKLKLSLILLKIGQPYHQ